MSIYLRFFNAVFAKGVDEPSGTRTAKWIIFPEVPAVEDDPETTEDESSERIPEERKFYKPIQRRALSLVAGRAGITEY